MDAHQLREAAASAVARGKLVDALAMYGELEALEPSAAAWPKRTGETYRRLGDLPSAVQAFDRAVEKYVRDGLLVQAIAVCKLILQIDPSHASTATRLAELAAPTAAEARATRRAHVIPRAQLEATRADAQRRTPQVTLPPGAPLDSIPLAGALPRARRVTRADGTDAGMSVLSIDIPFDDVDADYDDVEVIDPARVALLRTPLFAQLAGPALERLIARIGLCELAAGEVAFTEGEPGTTLYVISEGEVVVESGGRELAVLGAGAFFGEIALVTDLPRSATVRARARTELLSIDRDVLREATAEDPDVASAMLAFVRDRLVARVTRTSALFEPFGDDERARLARHFEVVEVDPDALLVTQGERADGLYLVLAGKVAVARASEPAPLATLGSGDVFGEMSLMSGRGGAANVRALTRVLALRLPAAAFQEVIMTYPQVLEYLGELADRRSRLRRAEEFIDLHIDLI